VFESEPPDFAHPLFKLPNILVAPHIAGVTAESMVRMAVESAENVLAALEGRLDPSVVINPEVL
jgi:D-3-phosphoglycerate dehydrogenase / 2-oxoglutarate reductase